MFFYDYSVINNPILPLNLSNRQEKSFSSIKGAITKP